MTLFYYNNMPFELNKRVFYVLSFFTSVQFSCSVVSDSLQPHGPQHAKASLPITNSWSLLKLMSIELEMPSNHLILCRPLLSRLQFFPASGSYQMRSHVDFVFARNKKVLNQFTSFISTLSHTHTQN